MKILALNFSPKANNSYTLKSAQYIQKYIKGAEIENINIGNRINSIAKKDNLLTDICDSIEKADAIMWIYPVYTQCVPYQLMRFIDLIFEKGYTSIFKNKFSIQILSSLHFYDHTAYNYMHQMSEELQMKHIDGVSVDMNDLTKEEGRKILKDTAKHINFSIENNIYNDKKYADTSTKTTVFDVTQSTKKENTDNAKLLIITDAKKEDISLNNMIDLYRNSLTIPSKVFNLNSFDFKSGCLSCLRCTISGECVIKDDFHIKHQEIIKGIECIVYAFSIKRHWMSSKFKLFDDRLFYNGHRISLAGLTTAYIVSGNLQNEPNLREVIESRVEVGHLYNAGIISDETDKQQTTKSITDLAKRTLWAIENKPAKSTNFLGVGGMKVFRDMIYIMRGFMKKDHQFYKKQKLYDFPQKDKKTIALMYLTGFMMYNKKMKKKAFYLINQANAEKCDKIIEKY